MHVDRSVTSHAMPRIRIGNYALIGRQVSSTRVRRLARPRAQHTYDPRNNGWRVKNPRHVLRPRPFLPLFLSLSLFEVRRRWRRPPRACICHLLLRHPTSLRPLEICNVSFRRQDKAAEQQCSPHMGRTLYMQERKLNVDAGDRYSMGIWFPPPPELMVKSMRLRRRSVEWLRSATSDSWLV